MAEAPDKDVESAAESAVQESASAEQMAEQALDGAESSFSQMQELAGQASFDADGDDAMGAIELLNDVELNVMIELGRTEMLVEDVLRLGAGSVVELDKLAGDPVDVYVNNRLIARAEVLVLNDNFCIRISEIVANLQEQAQAAAEQQQLSAT